MPNLMNRNIKEYPKRYFVNKNIMAEESAILKQFEDLKDDNNLTAWDEDARLWDTHKRSAVHSFKAMKDLFDKGVHNAIRVIKPQTTSEDPLVWLWKQSKIPKRVDEDTTTTEENSEVGTKRSASWAKSKTTKASVTTQSDDENYSTIDVEEVDLDYDDSISKKPYFKVKSLERVEKTTEGSLDYGVVECTTDSRLSRTEDKSVLSYMREMCSSTHFNRLKCTNPTTKTTQQPTPCRTTGHCEEIGSKQKVNILCPVCGRKLRLDMEVVKPKNRTVSYEEICRTFTPKMTHNNCIEISAEPKSRNIKNKLIRLMGKKTKKLPFKDMDSRWLHTK